MLKRGTASAGAFISQDIKIIVGNEKVVLTAHKYIFPQSAVLLEHCTIHDGMKYIVLPDDCPRNFVLLLEFLYWNDFTLFEENAFGVEANLEDHAKILAELYIMGDKYNLLGLKHAVLMKYDRVALCIASDKAWKVAQLIYEAVPATDMLFRLWFQASLRRDFDSMMSAKEARLCVEIGGTIALDIFDAQKIRILGIAQDKLQENFAAVNSSAMDEGKPLKRGSATSKVVRTALVFGENDEPDAIATLIY